VEKKFRILAGKVLGSERIEALADKVHNLESVSDVRELSAGLVPGL